jgi:hypothetical protein
MLLSDMNETLPTLKLTPVACQKETADLDHRPYDPRAAAPPTQLHHSASKQCAEAHSVRILPRPRAPQFALLPTQNDCARFGPR